MVNVGFVATTGGATNIQRFCPLPDTPVITTLTASTETICPGGVFTLDEQALDVTNTNNFTWSVTAGTGTISTPNASQAGIVQVSGAGVGSVIQMNYTDNCGHIFRRDYNIQPSALPTVTVNNLSICAGANWTLTPAPGGNYNTLSWVVTHPNGTVDPPVVGNTLSGLDAATVTVTPSITGCASAGNPVTVTVSATSLNPFDAGGPITHCIDAANPTYIHTPQSASNPLGFVSQPNFPLTWSISAANTGHIVNAATNGTLEVDQTGTYTLTATGGPGCVVTDDVYIELVTNPTVTIVPGGLNNDENICPGETMPLNVVGAFDHVTWSTGTLDNNTTDIAAAGNYTVQITIGTCSATDDIDIVETPAIVPTTGGDQLGICTNGNITLNGSTEPTYTAAWTITSTTGNIVSGQNTTDPIVSASGTYQLTVTNPEGCTATASAVVELLPVPIINLGSNFQVCPNLPFNIALNNTNCPNLNLVTSVLWSDNTTSNTFSSQVAPNGNQTVSVTLNINTCSASDNVVVSAFIPPLWDLGQTQTVCGDQPFVVTSTENVSWATSANSSITTGTSYTQNNPSPGTETLTATLTYGNGCVIFDNVDIDIIQPFTVNLPTTADFCEGSAIQIDAGNTVTWSNGDIGPTTMANEVGILTATYTDGPCTSQDQMTITMTFLPDIEWTDNTTYCEGTTVTLGAPGSHATSFYWSTGETSETIVVSESGYYSLTASNNCATVNRDIVLDFESCEAYAFIPNTFTPDKDGINEVWQPVIYNAKSYEVYIYNRWGDVIYHSTDPNENWLGEAHEGQHYVQDGVYGYRLILESPQREKKEYFGYFRMLR
jgi:gliding motility-associated-like protein